MWRLKRNETLQKFKKTDGKNARKNPNRLHAKNTTKKTWEKRGFCPGGLVLFGGRLKGSDYLRLLNKGCTKMDAII